MAIQAAAHNVLQLLHLAGEGAGVIEHHNGALRQIAQVTLRRQVGVDSIFSRQRTVGATEIEDLKWETTQGKVTEVGLLGGRQMGVLDSLIHALCRRQIGAGQEVLGEQGFSGQVRLIQAAIAADAQVIQAIPDVIRIVVHAKVGLEY